MFTLLQRPTSGLYLLSEVIFPQDVLLMALSVMALVFLCLVAWLNMGNTQMNYMNCKHRGGSGKDLNQKHQNVDHHHALDLVRLFVFLCVFQCYLLMLLFSKGRFIGTNFILG